VFVKLLKLTFLQESVTKFSAYITAVLCSVRWTKSSEGSQSCQTVKCGHESCGTKNEESLCWQGRAAIQQSVKWSYFLYTNAQKSTEN
jgi:hypothetical protein